MKKTVRVTITGTFTINEGDLLPYFEAMTFSEALEHQLQWINEGSASALEIMNEDSVSVSLEFVED